MTSNCRHLDFLETNLLSWVGGPRGVEGGDGDDGDDGGDGDHGWECRHLPLSDSQVCSSCTRGSTFQNALNIDKYFGYFSRPKVSKLFQ